MTYMDFFNKHFSDYTLDSNQRVRATPAVKTVNLKILTNLMKSKDRDLYE